MGSAPARLGPFRVGERLGAGGLGVVYAGVHEASGLAVALKVVVDRGSRWQAEDEVRAVAALDHPNIVTIHDHGEVDADRRWLAMELATGTLGASLPDDWSDVAEVLDAVLGALGHAHARARLHLDVKADNVLLGCRPPPAPGRRAAPAPARRATPSQLPASGRAGLRLADFGLSRRPGVAGRIAGTANGMAPEQCSPDGELGPATDLYALGCLAWELVTGAPVFAGGLDAVLHAHRARAPGRFVPQLAVPPDLEDWLRWLLEKDPAARPGLAADAAHALASLGEPVDPPEDAADAAPGSRGGATSTTFGWDAVAEDGAPPPVPGPPARAWAPPPLPAEAPEEPRRGRPTLLDAGVGLLPWRTLPMAGWAAERARLWAALRLARDRTVRVRLAGSPEAAERVAGWLGERAMAAGAGWFVRPGLDAPPNLGPRPRVIWLDGDPPSALAAVARAALDGAGALVLGTPTSLPEPGDLPDVALGAPDPLEVRGLLAEVLALDTALAEGLAERAGDADVALSWVAGLARAGALAAGPAGWGLAPGASLGAAAPAGAGLDRLRAAEPDADGPTWRAAERLAAWDAPIAAAAEAGLTERDVDGLVAAGLLAARDGRRALRSGLDLALLAHARERGRSDALHAELLAGGAPDDARRGLWLLRSGRPAEAVGPLLAALTARWRERRARLADADRAVEALAAAGVDPADERWGQARIHALWIRRLRGVEGLEDEARAVVDWADAHGHAYVSVLARRVLAQVAPAAERVPLLLAAADLAEASGVPSGPRLRAVSWNDAGAALLGQGRLRDAEAHLDRAAASGEADALVRANRADLALRRGRAAEAVERLDGLAFPDAPLEARVATLRSDALRAAGRAAEARAEAVRAAAVARSASAWPGALEAELRVLWVDADAGRPWRARVADLLAGSAALGADDAPFARFWIDRALAEPDPAAAAEAFAAARRKAADHPLLHGLLDEALGAAVPDLAGAVRRGPRVPVEAGGLARAAVARMRAGGRVRDAEALLAALRGSWESQGCDADLAATADL